jgi:hypothetical protein
MSFVIRKTLHTFFISLFLLYAVAPIWLQVGYDDAALAAEASAVLETYDAPRLLIDGCLLHADRAAGRARASTLRTHEDEGSGILLKKKRAVLSSKKPTEPPASEAAPQPPHLDLHIAAQPYRIIHAKLTTVVSFAYYHSGCSPPRS